MQTESAGRPKIEKPGELKFIVDNNVGKLAKWLRMMGYDTLFFDGPDDTQMVRIAFTEGRIIITKDTQLMERRIITSGRLQAVLITDDDPECQVRQVIEQLKLDCNFNPFSLCLECNRPLEPRAAEDIKDRVPPYVFKTQSRYVECPDCHRIYWPGTHWQAMVEKLKEFCGQV